MSPLQALWSAFLYVCSRWPSHRQGIPGEVIERMGPETRHALSQLKSEDISPEKVRRDDLVGSDEYYQHKRQQQERLEFDKKLKR